MLGARANGLWNNTIMENGINVFYVFTPFFAASTSSAERKYLLSKKLLIIPPGVRIYSLRVQ